MLIGLASNPSLNNLWLHVAGWWIDSSSVFQMSGQKLLRIELGFRPAEDQEGKNNRRQEDHYWSVSRLWSVCDAWVCVIT